MLKECNRLIQQKTMHGTIWLYNNLKNVSKLLNDTKIINLDHVLKENIKRDIDNIYLYVKHQYEEKYRFLINKKKV